MNRPISPLRKIINKLIEERASTVNSETKILEIGCGHFDTFKNAVEKNNGNWFGLDPKGELATHRGSVKNIPFEDDFFDIVVCSQTIEHWYEYTTTFDNALCEIFRVLKLGGRLLLDYPLYLHGHPLFMLGKQNEVEKLFSSESWEIQSVDHYMPSYPYYTWISNKSKYADEWFCEKIIKKQNKSSKIVSMVIKKNEAKYLKLEKSMHGIIVVILFFILSKYKNIRSYSSQVLQKYLKSMLDISKK